MRYSFLSDLPDDKADIFAVSLLMPCCIFSFQISSSVSMISFYVLSKRFFLKCRGLSDARVVPITKKNDFALHFI